LIIYLIIYYNCYFLCFIYNFIRDEFLFNILNYPKFHRLLFFLLFYYKIILIHMYIYIYIYNNTMEYLIFLFICCYGIENSVSFRGIIHSTMTFNQSPEIFNDAVVVIVFLPLTAYDSPLNNLSLFLHCNMKTCIKGLIYM